MSLVVYLDLDRTLFRTSEFGPQKWPLLEKMYPQINGESEHARQSQFYVRNGDSYAYDFSAHLESLELDLGEVYDILNKSALADGRLEYDGVADLVSWIRQRGEVKVLTYGVDEYQRLKASLCPSLKGVEIITTLRPKAEYLADKGDVWLVDDKYLADELPSNVRFIQALLEGQNDEVGDWPKATRLAEVIDMFKSAT